MTKLVSALRNNLGKGLGFTEVDLREDWGVDTIYIYPDVPAQYLLEEPPWLDKESLRAAWESAGRPGVWYTTPPTPWEQAVIDTLCTQRISVPDSPPGVLVLLESLRKTDSNALYQFFCRLRDLGVARVVYTPGRDIYEIAGVEVGAWSHGDLQWGPAYVWARALLALPNYAAQVAANREARQALTSLFQSKS